MVQPIIPQPITDMGYGGVDFLRKFKENLRGNKVPIAQAKDSEAAPPTVELVPTSLVMPTPRKFGDERSIFEKDAEEDRFKKMQMLNGNTFENGERSQGDQEAEQRMVQNKATGLLQKFVGRFKDFLNRGPFPGSEDDPRTPTGSKLITGPDGKPYDENFIKTIPGGFNNMQEIERRRKIFEGM